MKRTIATALFIAVFIVPIFSYCVGTHSVMLADSLPPHSSIIIFLDFDSLPALKRAAHEGEDGIRFVQSEVMMKATNKGASAELLTYSLFTNSNNVTDGGMLAAVVTIMPDSTGRVVRQAVNSKEATKMLRYQISSHANKAEKVSPKTHDTIAITNAYDLLSICTDALQTEYTDTPHPSIQSVKTLKDLAQPFFNRYKIQVLVRRNSVYYTFKSTANVDVFNVSVENKYYPNEATYHTLQLGLRPMTPHYIEREGRAFHHDNIPLKNYFYARIFLEKVVSIKSGTYKAHTTEYSRFYYLYRSLTPPDNLTQGSMDNATQNVYQYIRAKQPNEHATAMIFSPDYGFVGLKFESLRQRFGNDAYFKATHINGVPIAQLFEQKKW